MDWYAATDGDWNWDTDEGDGLTVVLAETPQEAAEKALAEWDEIEKADGGDIKVARLDLVGFAAYERRDDGTVAWDAFLPMPDASNAAALAGSVATSLAAFNRAQLHRMTVVAVAYLATLVAGAVLALAWWWPA